MKMFILLIGIMFLTGCATIQNYKSIERPVNDVTTNNETVLDEPVSDSTVVSEKENIFFFQEEGTCVFVVHKDNSTTLIDCGASTTVIRKIRELGYEKIDNYILTSIERKEIKSAQKLALNFEPKNIYYSFQSSYLPTIESNYIRVTNDEVADNFILEPSYKSGLLNEVQHNTILVYLDGAVILGTCEGQCEKSISNDDRLVLALANNGNCPTNSDDVLYAINPKYVIVNSLVCDNLQSTLENTGVKVFDVAVNPVRVVVEDNEVEYVQ